MKIKISNAVILIFGGRAINEAKALSFLKRKFSITESLIVSGCAKGADTAGILFAEHYGLSLKLFPANWDKYKNRAGPIRNRAMAKEPITHAIMFPGGTGTYDMFQLLQSKNSVRLYIVRTKNKSTIKRRYK